MDNDTNTETALEFDQNPAKTAQVRLKDFPRGSISHIFRRASFNFLSSNGTDSAAALTYFTVLSIFPGLLAFVSLLGIVGQGQESATVILEFLQENAPQQMYSIVENPIRQLTNGQGAGIALLIGILSALWSASGYISSFGRAINRIYGVREGRPVWVLIPFNMLITTAVVVLAVLMMLMLLLGVDVLNIVGSHLPPHVDIELVKVLWLNGRWVLIFLAAVGLIAMLYTATPNIRHEKTRRMTPGAFVALTGMALGGFGFTLYTNNFSKYNATYGLIGGVIVMLLFTWIMNNMLLYGAHLDAEIERMRQLVAGEHSEDIIRVEVRDDRALKILDRKNETLISQANMLQRKSGGQQIMPKPKGLSLPQRVSQKVTAIFKQVRGMFKNSRNTSQHSGSATLSETGTQADSPDEPGKNPNQPKLF
ncbi:YihY/virulence factor BrkB family protein [Rothia aeria]|jgi:yihY family protein|uniref:YihY/virulence factor BrkB family protein n=1 Tax=Rothia aeria TaxID=172042 RepID=UPI00254BFAB4|nr:YihY/virulence factor BrkB family protein [Rothia aeria]MDK7352677.1 YihY/virulence factor BrkB family protein [Rothia aeria]